jgi:hypothetical protein
MPKHFSDQEVFSKSLRHWLKTSKNQTLDELIKVTAEKSFAIIFLLMMALPALPIPTGGITHVTELITLLGALQLIIGRRTIWLPKRWLKVDVGKFMTGKAVSKLISVVEWFERKSRRRWSGFLVQRPVVSFTGIFITIFTIAAFVAVPFSGLDTLPALGVVIMSLGLILEDTLIWIIGIAIGSVGIGVEIAAGTALYSGLTHLF